MTDRNAKRAHGAILAVLALGVAVWLWRVYGFEPLAVRPW